MSVTIEFFEKESGEVRANHEYFVLNGEVWRDNYDTCESQQAVVGFDRFVVKVPEIGWRVPALASKEAEIARLRADAERYQCIRRVTGAGRDIGGRVSFVLPVINTVKGANLMRGSVAQHFDDAIDAIRALTQPTE